jgi:hypothetical protein
MEPIKELYRRAQDEAGHAYAYGGGSILALVLVVLLILWLVGAL